MKTDEELNALFAEKVAGWTHARTGVNGGLWFSPIRDVKHQLPSALPNFCSSMDAVIPWLEKHEAFFITKDIEGKRVIEIHVREARSVARSVAGLPRACVLALLRAHGVEV